MLAPGDKAPSFTLPTDGGGTLSSEALGGVPYVLYFYPKDNTPGCTTEACDFRDRMDRLVAAGVRVVGVSKDTAASHDRFKAKHGLNFPLVADPELGLHKAYGAWGKKMMYGKEREATIRSTFLVGADGTILKVWPKVKVKGHVDDVLAAVDELLGG